MESGVQETTTDVCRVCGRRVEVCALCERVECVEPICHRDVLLALGESVVVLHEHGG
ncbi:MAG TPA: hypothetical protein VE669_03545 [Actinomycetota bacterium]|nr:hypothetical protein [Actinomycetota bacterium]